MKKLLTLLISLIVLFTSCENDIIELKKEGSAQFGFSCNPSNQKSLKNSSLKEAEEPAAIVLSIKNAKGELVYNMEKVELYNMNGSYISKPLSLLVGDFTLEKFMIVNDSDSVIYVAPIQGSPKAYLVENPLPLNFSTSKDVVTKVIPEVLSVGEYSPEDFGYSTFSFNVVETFDFLIGIFVYNESIQNFELADAHFKVESNGKTLYTDTLSAITNNVTVADGYNPYILTVTKEGYKTWVDTLTSTELKLYFKSTDLGPLKVILEKSNNSGEIVSLVTDQRSLSKVTIWIKGNNITPSPVLVNWGDGSFTNCLLDTSYLSIEHDYSTANIYNITVTGDLDKITFFGSYRSNIIDVNINSLNNIEGVNFSNNKITHLNLLKNLKLKELICDNNLLSSLDLSNNSNLTTIFADNNQLQNVDLRNKSKLYFVSINHNRLINIDLRGDNELSDLSIIDNQLKTLIIDNSNLTKLSCGNNLLDTLNIESCLKLELLLISKNNIKGLSLSQNIQLKEINISQNPINKLNLESNKEIRRINMQNTNITQLNLNEILATVLSFKRYSIPDDNCYIYTTQVPSGDGIRDMIELRNVYGWMIWLNVN